MKTKNKTPELYFNGNLAKPLLGCAACGKSWHPKGCDEAHGWELPEGYATCPQCGQAHAPIERARIGERIRVKLPARVASWLTASPLGTQRAFSLALREGLALR